MEENMIKKALNQTRLIPIIAFLLMLYTSSATAMMGGGMGVSSTDHMDNARNMANRQMVQDQQQMHNENMEENMSDQQMLDSQHLNDQDMNHDAVDHDKMNHDKIDHESNQKMAEDFFQE